MAKEPAKDRAVGDKISGLASVDFCDISDTAKAVINSLNYRGVSGSKFFACERDNVRFLLKIAFHTKVSAGCRADDSPRGENKTIPTVEAEIRTLQAIREHITDTYLSPCALDLVYSQTCDLAGLVNQISCEDVMTKVGKDDHLTIIERAICRHRDLVEAGQGLPAISFLVLDRCDITLGDFLGKVGTAVDVIVLKSLLFSIVHFFAVFRRIWPGARHRDLHTDNVMLKIDPGFDLDFSRMRFLEFKYPENPDDIPSEFYVPFFGFYAKVIDFGFATIPEMGIDSAIHDDTVMMSRRADNDLVFLFHWIYHATRSSAMARQVDNLLSALDPTRSYIHYYVPAVNSAEVPTPEEMLGSRVWREYKKKSGTLFARYSSPK